MKRLSDYKGEEAVDLWADLLDPLSEICTNEKIKKAVESGEPRISVARTVLQECRSEAVRLLERIDPEPLNGLNIITRLVGLLAEIGQDEDVRSFFGYASQTGTDGESSGFAMANTGAAGN